MGSISKHDVAKPNAAQPDVAQPDVAQPSAAQPLWRTMQANVISWLGGLATEAVPYDATLASQDHQIDWLQNLPYVLLHLLCLGVFWVGFSWTALGVAIALYFIRMFAITAFYHRYFSHRAFQTNRFWQFVFAVLGNSAAQRGPLWWAGHHRLHHKHSDSEHDLHSPVQKGFWWSHLGWFMTKSGFQTPLNEIKDFAKFPELLWLDQFSSLVPLGLAVGLYGVGWLLYHYVPAIGTNGLQLLVWGFFISTVCQHHATFTINSLAHIWGNRRYTTSDNSRNNLVLALITMGEGWHNNHHRFPHTARQGIFWWEIDMTYGILKLMSWCGMIWNLKPVPKHAL